MNASKNVTAKSLLVAAGLDETLWGKRIIQIERTGIVPDEWLNEAWGWQTCACGRQDERIPRDKYGAPLDYKLACDGEWFPFYLRHDIVEAARCLIRIEERAAEVLKEVVRPTSNEAVKEEGDGA